MLILVTDKRVFHCFELNETSNLSYKFSNAKEGFILSIYISIVNRKFIRINIILRILKLLTFSNEKQFTEFDIIKPLSSCDTSKLLETCVVNCRNAVVP